MFAWSTAQKLARNLQELTFCPPVTHVYNPLIYAAEPHREYLTRYGGGPKEVVFLGMNPGPWGMAQTGVPFGEVSIVRDWLGIRGRVDRPDREHPKKVISGFDCRRSEVSGRRLWGLFREVFGRPEVFFERYFVMNYCPLLFLDEDGRNLTPDQLPAGQRETLFQFCDDALRHTLACLDARQVVAVGGFAEVRARQALREMNVRIGRILHPSPASPAANRGWAALAVAQLAEQGILFPAS